MTTRGIDVDAVMELARDPLQAELTTILEGIAFEDLTVYEISALVTVARPVYARVLLELEQRRRPGVRLVGITAKLEANEGNK